MPIQSLEFLFIFLPVVVGGYWLFSLDNRNSALAFLTTASLVFYGWMSWWFVAVLIGSIIINYIFAHLLRRWQHIFVLFLGIVANLLLLVAFKFGSELLSALVAFAEGATPSGELPPGYLLIAIGGSVLVTLVATRGLRWRVRFPTCLAIVATVVLVLVARREIVVWAHGEIATGLPTLPPFLETIVLPLGLSFLTLQQIAFLVDVREARAVDLNPLHYCFFTSFFPQLSLGPIWRWREFADQLHPGWNPDFHMRVSAQNTFVGVTLIAFGVFKKVVIADSLAGSSSAVFSSFSAGNDVAALELWWAAVTFGLRLFFELSAYADMAMGAARLFGIRLPLNMDSPYRAVGVVDFWRRWHVTLSRFIAQILYRPLSGGRTFSLRAHEAYLIVMVLFGLWHDFTWSFVLFGSLHGGFLLINHAWIGLRHSVFKSTGEIRFILYRWPMQLLTFLAVSVAWVAFVVDDHTTAIAMMFSMFGAQGFIVPESFGSLWAWMGSIVPEVFWQSVEPFTAWLPDAPVVTGTLSEVSTGQWLTTLFLLLLVWLMPSTHEMLARHDPAWEEIDPEEKARRTVFRWSPTVWHGIALGVVLALALRVIVTTGPDGFGTLPFIYGAF